MKDPVYALRGLRKAPGFSAVAIVSLALGIGLNSSVFSVVEAVFLRSWPARDPQQLARVIAQTSRGDDPTFSYPEYRDLSQQASSFSGVLAVSRHSRFIETGADSRLILVDVVSPNYFAVLGLTPTLGRAFSPGRTREGAPPVLLSHQVWRSDFGADASLIGKTVMLSGKAHTVIGVAPPGFRGLERMVPTDAWLPAPEELPARELEQRTDGDYELLARLQPGNSVARAQKEVELISRRLAEQYPTGKGRSFTLVSESDRLKEAVRPSLFLMTVVGLVLLVACANVAGLVLARSESRRQEIAIRTALGATPRDLLRLLLCEGLLLAFAGGTLGLLLMRLLIQAQPAFMPPAIIPLQFNLRAGGPVLLFTVAISLASTLLFALAPALRASRPDLVAALKGEVKALALSNLTFRNLLVVAQIATAAVLLAASALLLRNLVNSTHIRPGFDTAKDLVFFNLSFNGNRQQRAAFFGRLADRVAGIPGVKQTSFANRALLSGSGGGAALKVQIPGSPASDEQSVTIKFNAVAQNYFRTVGSAVIEGRTFTAADDAPGARVVVVDQTMARRYWPHADPVGKYLKIDGNDFQIIGVTEPARIIAIHETPEPYLYFTFSELGNGGTLIAEASGNPGAVIPAIREAVRGIDRNVPVLQVFTVTELMHAALWEDRMCAGLVSALGISGMFLAAVGLYGVIAWLVSRRSREMGVRMALGAQPADVRRLVLGQAFKLAATGTVIGMTVTLAVGRFMASALYGIPAWDPLSLLAACSLIFIIAIAACYVPARHASKVDPVVALRCE